MGTIAEKVERDAQGVLAAVIGRYGAKDLVTHVGDHLTDAMHALTYALAAEGLDGDTVTDMRSAVLGEVERAVSHFLCEFDARRAAPEDDEDTLGGYVNPTVWVTT